MYVFHTYTVFEFMLISLFYIKVISNWKINSVIILLNLLFLGVAIFEFMHKIYVMDDLSTTVESILVMLYAVFGYYLLLKNPVQSQVTAIPLFWFHSAFLLYFAGNLFLFVFINYVNQHFKGLSNQLWSIHSVMSIILYSLIAIGFWKTKTR